jgi:2-keto-4-pentenoate hydratase
MRLLLLTVFATLAAGPAFAQTTCEAYAKPIVEGWLNKTPIKSPGDLTLEQGTCTQAAVVDALSKTQGKVIGYKAGLTSKGAQQQLGVPHPLLGTLLSKMMVPDGATVPVTFGFRPLYEADLLVTVRDDGVNQARTPIEVAQHLSTLQPFIELPDLMLAEGEPMTAPVLLAINASARLGVVGAPVPVRATPDFVDALAAMQVVVLVNGNELGRAPGRLILDHPLNAVVFIAEELQRRGSKLKPGDLLSLGSFSRLAPPAAGQTITVRYDGLPTGPMTVSVAFK